MRAMGCGSRVLGALACAISVAVVQPAIASAAPRARMVREHRPQTRGSASPFRLAHSKAQGIVLRRGRGALHAFTGLSSPTFASSSCTASCATPLLYHGGEVMHKVKVYLIQWEPPIPGVNGQVGTEFTKLPEAYRSQIAEYAQHVAAASGTFGNVYSTDMLYGESGLPGEYKAEFGGSFRDEDLYPERKASTCPTPTAEEEFYPPAGQPCISDGESLTSEPNFQLGEELFKYLQAHPALPIGLGTIYFMLLPHNVNTCAGFSGSIAACNTNFFCAYHSWFFVEGGGVSTPVVYANMPYNDVPGCETPDQPHASAADDEINTLSHEHNEAITDPLGEGWFDIQGQEIGDKCTFPFFDPSEDSSPVTDAYGTLLGGTPKGGSASPGTAFNQEIAGGDYLLQREWSNAAGGCVSEAPKVHPAFVASTASGRSVSFDGRPSSTEAGEISQYSWEFGDGAGGSGAEVTHEYAAPGEYTVKLTVRNDSGATESTVEKVTLAAPAAPITTTTTTTTTASFSAPRVGPFTASALAKLLGLPGSGAKLKGLGTISLGHAACPPACSLKGRIVASSKGKGRHAKHVQIGSLKMTLASKGAGSIAMRLTAKGRELLRHSRGHGLSVTLVLVVEDQQGASWQLQRRLTLTR